MAEPDKRTRWTQIPWIKDLINPVPTEVSPGMSEDEINRVIMKRIKVRETKRTELMQHGVAFVASNIAVWALYLSGIIGAVGGPIPWPAWVTGIWSLVLAAHAGEYYQHTPRAQARRDQNIRDEFERERARLGLGPSNEKLKNEVRAAAYRLNAEGELEKHIDSEESIKQRIRQGDSR